MSEKITVPTLGVSNRSNSFEMAQGSRRKVSADEPLVELETDKVNVVPSPTNGVLEASQLKRVRQSTLDLY